MRYQNTVDRICFHEIGKIYCNLYLLTTNSTSLEAMANIKTESANSPYGDLQGSKAQNAKVLRDKEYAARLIDSNSINSDDHSESDSELAMAVDDILSCCDPNSAQAKLIRDMGRSMIERTNHLGGDEEKQELFSDEYAESPSLLGSFSPSKIMESMKTGSKTKSYPVRSSSSFSGSIKERETKFNCRYGVLPVVFILLVAALLRVYRGDSISRF